MDVKRIFITMSLMLAVPALSACVHSQAASEDQDIPMVRQYPKTTIENDAGKRVGGLIGMMLHYHGHVVDHLLDNGVQVVRVGDEVKIILPTDLFFNRDSANLKVTKRPILNDVIVLMQAFQKISVSVFGYTDNQGDWQRNQALSLAQAQTIENILARANIDTRIMYVKGMGEQDPIADNTTAKGQAQNRRVEISFRKIEQDVLV